MCWQTHTLRVACAKARHSSSSTTSKFIVPRADVFIRFSLFAFPSFFDFLKTKLRKNISISAQLIRCAGSFVCLRDFKHSHFTSSELWAVNRISCKLINVIGRVTVNCIVPCREPVNRQFVRSSTTSLNFSFLLLFTGTKLMRHQKVEMAIQNKDVVNGNRFVSCAVWQSDDV